MADMIDFRAPAPVDLSHHLSRTTRRREPSQIKKYYKYFEIPGIGQLAGGLPNSHYFPYDTLGAKAALPDRWTPTANDPVDPPSSRLAKFSSNDKKDNPPSPPESQLVVPHTSSTANPNLKIDLDTALQYGQAQGYPPLYSYLLQFVRENLHPNIPYAGGPDIILTCGSTDGFNKVVTALSNEWSEGHDKVEDKEGIVCEEYCYMNAIQTVQPRGMNIAPIAVDDEGMAADGPGGLRDVLENWNFSKGKRPHLMYTITIGQNPTGGCLSVTRRKAIYELCVQYDVIVIEDDPYWYLQYPSANKSSVPAVPKPVKSSGYEFLDSLIPSYLSLDWQGRVVRLDTFSKTVAPGCRLGWITAQPALVERLLRITETSTQQPSGFVQSMIAELIIGPSKVGIGDGKGGAADGKGWEVGGWVRWLEGLRGEYERRMTDMCDALDEGQCIVKSGRRPSMYELHTHNGSESSERGDDWSVVEKTQLYYYVRPLGGMFVWIRLHFDTHPMHKKSFTGEELSRALWVFWTTEKYRVLASPGTMFAPTPEVLERGAWQCFRLCFAAIEREDVTPVTKRLVKGIHAFWRIKDEETIQHLLDENDTSAEGAEGVNRMGNMAAYYGC